MQKITIELDAETIARLKACNGNPDSAMGNEILGMTLIEAYAAAQSKKRAKRK